MALRLRVLGAPLLEHDGQVLDVRAQGSQPDPASAAIDGMIAFDAPEVTGLLAYLAVTGQAHERSALAGLLWSGTADADAELEHATAVIAESAGDILRDDGGRLALESDKVSVDHRFVEQLQAEIDAHDHPATAVCRDCVAPLTAIATLHRGPFLDGFVLPASAGYDRWRVATADQLDDALAVTLARLSDAHVLSGELDAAVDVARRLVALDPLSEAAHRRLMRLHAWQEQPQAAIEQYRECVRALQSELGVSPLEVTARLSEDVLAGRVPPPPVEVTASGSGAADLQWSGAEPATAPDASPASPVPKPAPLVGREHELGMLSDAMARVNSDGLVIVVEGEAGIGKSRLLREFGAHSEHGRRRVLTAAGHPGDTTAPFGVVIELLRSALRPPDATRDWLADLRPDAVRELGRVLPEVAAVAGQPPPAAGPGAVWRLIDALAAAVFAAASAPSNEWLPGVVLVDDAQWIDQSSLDVLSHLANRLQGRPVGLVLSWRTELVGRGHRLRQLVASLARRQLVRQLPLDRLDADAVRLLYAEMLGVSHDEVAALSEQIMENTDGVPRVVIDHIATVAAHAGGPRPTVSHGRERVASRMAGLSPVAWQVAAAAAVIGRPFDVATVRRVSGRTRDEIRDGLNRLLRAGVLTRSTGRDAGYDIDGADLRAFICAQADPARRRLLHARAAVALERQVRSGQVEPARAVAIASHHRAGGDHTAAAVWFDRAGATATDMLAVPEATSHYEAALALGPEQPQRVHEALGDLKVLEGRYRDALARYEAAVAMATDPELPALEHKIAGVYLRLGRWLLAEEHLAMALSGLDRHTAGTTALRARILTNRGLVALRRGRDKEAVTSAQAALRAAEETKDLGALASTHNLLGVLSRQDLATAREHLERALECARTLRDADIEIAAAENLAQAHAAAGSLERALPLVESALARAGQMGDRHREASLRNTLADLLHAAGRNGEAMAHLKRAVTLLAEIGEPDDEPPEARKFAAW